MQANMLNGTKADGSFWPFSPATGERQGAFPESLVRHVYLQGLMPQTFHSKYVRAGKGLKATIKLYASKLANFCRLIPIFLWVGSLPALARGGMLCQLVID